MCYQSINILLLVKAYLNFETIEQTKQFDYLINLVIYYKYKHLNINLKKKKLLRY